MSKEQIISELNTKKNDLIESFNITFDPGDPLMLITRICSGFIIVPVIVINP